VKEKEYSQVRGGGLVSGARYERERITALAKNKVCFDHRKTGNCDHSACFEMSDLIALINGENERVEE
jgi:hypothetical protein